MTVTKFDKLRKDGFLKNYMESYLVGFLEGFQIIFAIIIEQKFGSLSEAFHQWIKSLTVFEIKEKSLALCTAGSLKDLGFDEAPNCPSKGCIMSLYFPTRDEYSTHDIFPGVQVRTCVAEQMMLSLATLQPHSVVEEHSHPHEQVGIVLEGRATFYIGDEEKTLGPGELFRIPGNVKHKVVALDEMVKALDIFHPIREDYL